MTDAKQKPTTEARGEVICTANPHDGWPREWRRPEFRWPARDRAVASRLVACGHQSGAAVFGWLVDSF
jgi:hypothetical protein